LNIEVPSSKTKYGIFSDSEKYCKGMMKRKLLTGEIDPEPAIL